MCVQPEACQVLPFLMTSLILVLTAGGSGHICCHVDAVASTRNINFSRNTGLCLYCVGNGEDVGACLHRQTWGCQKICPGSEINKAKIKSLILVGVSVKFVPGC